MKEIEITQRDVRQKKNFKSSFDYQGKSEDLSEQLIMSLDGFMFTFKKMEDVGSKEQKVLYEIKKRNKLSEMWVIIKESSKDPGITSAIFDNLIGHIKKRSKEYHSSTSR